MSAVSGVQSKGEKVSKKFQYQNINRTYKGLSVEKSQKSVITKHGMQTLGKVATVRRIPPVLLPSLKAENCGNDPTVSLVPSGGQGWGTTSNNSSSSTQQTPTTPNSTTQSSSNTQQTASSTLPQNNNNSNAPNFATKKQGTDCVSPQQLASAAHTSGSSGENKATVNGVSKGSAGLNTSSASSLLNNNTSNNNSVGQKNPAPDNRNVPLLGGAPSTPLLVPGAGVVNSGASKRVTTSPGLVSVAAAGALGSRASEDKNRGGAGGDRRGGGGAGGGSGGTVQQPQAAPAPVRGWSNTPNSSGTTAKQGPVPLLGGPASGSNAAPTLASVTAGHHHQQQPAPFSAKEFPKLGSTGGGGGGNSSSSSSSTVPVNTQDSSSLRYGPGPSLRPHSEFVGRAGGGGPHGVNTGGGSTGGAPPQSSSGTGSSTGATTAPASSTLTGHGSNSTAPSGGSAGSSSSQSGATNKPTQFRGMMPAYMGGNDMDNFSGSFQSYSRGFSGGGSGRGGGDAGYSSYRRPAHHTPPQPPTEPDLMPLPIIKKEELEQFQDIPDSSDGWANSAKEVDFNKKLNFSEDEAIVDDDRRGDNKWSSSKNDARRFNNIKEGEVSKGERSTPSPLDKSEAYDAAGKEKVPLLQQRPGRDDNRRVQGGNNRFDMNTRWSNTSNNTNNQQQKLSPQPLLGPSPHPQPLLPCPPQSGRRFPAQSGGSQQQSYGDGGGVEVVQQALSKAQQREKEEHKRYEEKQEARQQQYGDGHKKGRGDEGSGALSEGGGEGHSDMPAPRGGDNRRGGDMNKYGGPQSYNRGYDHRRDHHMFGGGGGHIRTSNLPPRLQKQQQQYHHGGGGYRSSNNQPMAMFEPQFGSNNRQYNRDGGDSVSSDHSTASSHYSDANKQHNRGGFNDAGDKPRASPDVSPLADGGAASHEQQQHRPPPSLLGDPTVDNKNRASPHDSSSVLLPDRSRQMSDTASTGSSDRQFRVGDWSDPTWEKTPKKEDDERSNTSGKRDDLNEDNDWGSYHHGGNKQWSREGSSSWSSSRDDNSQQQHYGRNAPPRNNFDGNNFNAPPKGKYDKPKSFDEQGRQCFDQRKDDTRWSFDDNRRGGYDTGRRNYQDQSRRHFDDQENTREYGGAEEHWGGKGGSYDGRSVGQDHHRRSYEKQRPGYQDRYEDQQRPRSYGSAHQRGPEDHRDDDQYYYEDHKVGSDDHTRRSEPRNYDQQRYFDEHNNKQHLGDGGGARGVDQRRRDFDDPQRMTYDRHHDYQDDAPPRLDEQKSVDEFRHDDSCRNDSKLSNNDKAQFSSGATDEQSTSETKNNRSYDRRSKDYEHLEGGFDKQQTVSWSAAPVDDRSKRTSEEKDLTNKFTLGTSSWADDSADCDFDSQSKHNLSSGKDDMADVVTSDSNKSMPVVPSPITKERLEACDKEKEIRKNMTTLKKGAIPDLSDRADSKAAANSKEAQLQQQQQASREKTNAWGNNTRTSKNGDRSRPVSAATNSTKGGDNNAAGSWAEKIAGQTSSSSNQTTEKNNKQSKGVQQTANNKSQQQSNNSNSSSGPATASQNKTALLNRDNNRSSTTTTTTHKLTSPLLETPTSVSSTTPTASNRETLTSQKLVNQTNAELLMSGNKSKSDEQECSTITAAENKDLIDQQQQMTDGNNITGGRGGGARGHSRGRGRGGREGGGNRGGGVDSRGGGGYMAGGSRGGRGGGTSGGMSQGSVGYPTYRNGARGKYTEYSSRSRGGGSGGGPPRLKKHVQGGYDDYYYDGYNNYYSQGGGGAYGGRSAASATQQKDRKEEWSDVKEEDNNSGDNHYRGGGGSGRAGGRGGGRGASGGAAPIKPRGAPMPLSSVVVSAPLMGIDTFSGGEMEAGGRKHGASVASRYDQHLPPRFQKRMEERGRGSRRGGAAAAGGGGGSVRARGGRGKESSPDNPDKDWETDSDNSGNTSDKSAAANKKDAAHCNTNESPAADVAADVGSGGAVAADVDGFQEVSRRKSTKEKGNNKADDSNKSSTPDASEANAGSNNARRGKDKKNVGKHQPSAYERSRPVKLPPRLAKQRENNNRMGSDSTGANTTASTDSKNTSSSSSASNSSTANSVPPPPIKNAWEKPLTAALRSNSPSLTQSVTSQQQQAQHEASVGNSSGTGAVPLNKAVNNRDSQHEPVNPSTLLGASDARDNSVATLSNSQRSSPANLPQVMTKDDKSTLDGSSVPSKTIIFENTNFKAAAGLTNNISEFANIAGSGVKYSSVGNNSSSSNNSSFDSGKPQRQHRDRRSQQQQQQQQHHHQQQLSQSMDQQMSSHISSHHTNKTDSDSSKQDKPEPIELPVTFPKAEESDMKIDFTFNSDLELRADKVGVSKSLNLVRSLAMTTSVHTPNSPSTEELNMKIASVKKMWDMDMLPSVTEHAVEETMQQPSSFATSNFSNVASSHDNSGGQDHVSATMDSYPGTSNKDNMSSVSRGDDSQDVYNSGMPQQQQQQQGPPGVCASSSTTINTSGPHNVNNNMVYTSAAVAASFAKAEVSRTGNVCKVKPQQQSANSSGPVGAPPGVVPSGVNNCGSPVPSGVSNSSLGMACSASGGGGAVGSMSPPLSSSSVGGHTTTNNMYPTIGSTAAFGGLGQGAIPSPPIMYNAASQQVPQTGLYQSFVEPRNPASQFSQYYSLGQGLGNNAFGQQSMFLQTPPLTAPTDMYANNLSQYRLQPAVAAAAGFGQTPQPQNQNTVLISSANSTLMSSAVKPSTQTFGGNSQQNFGTIGSKTGTPFQQSGLNNAAALQGAPPQTPLYIYEQLQPIGLLGSQLMQRPPVQGSVLQTIQTPNSFYSNNGGSTAGAAGPSATPTQQAAAAGFFPTGSTLQAAAAAVQQQSQPTLQTPPAAAYGLQGFANQSQAVPAAAAVGFNSSLSNLAAQQINAAVAAQSFRGGNSAATALPTNFLKSLQPGVAAGTAAGLQDPTRQQVKSPNALPNNFSSTYFSAQQSNTQQQQQQQQGGGSNKGGGGVPPHLGGGGVSGGVNSGGGVVVQGMNATGAAPNNNGSRNNNSSPYNNNSVVAQHHHGGGPPPQLQHHHHHHHPGALHHHHHMSNNNAPPQHQQQQQQSHQFPTGLRGGGSNTAAAVPTIVQSSNSSLLGRSAGGINVTVATMVAHQQQASMNNNSLGGASHTGAGSRYSGPGPIQRPPASTSSSHHHQQQQQRMRTHHQQHPTDSTQCSLGGVMPGGGHQRGGSTPTSAQKAKLRAETLSSTQAFFNREAKAADKKDDKNSCGDNKATTVSSEQQQPGNNNNSSNGSTGNNKNTN